MFSFDTKKPHIDNFKDVSKSIDQRELTGVGEVKIGDFVWNKIKFVVTLNSQNNRTNKVTYKIEK